MSTLIQGGELRSLLLGRKVERATATLPQTTSYDLFTVTGGRILLTSIVGEVTTVIQTQANATKLIATPTTGSAVDMCATKDITALEVGGKLTITGTVATAMVQANAGSIPVGPAAPGVVVSVGTIKLSCAASNTGSIKWTLTYVPLDDGAAVTAA